jgi:nucleotide-binding universal stress UspA family protein
MKRGNKSGDTKVVAHAARVLGEVDRRWRFKQFLPFMGPAFIASIAYIDPGNFATNIQGGAEFGYALLWVILASNLMAMLLQTLSAKLGIASGINLAEHCRNQFPPVIVWLMWGVMEVVSMATDLAEFLGAALGLYLLFGIPLWIAAVLTAIITLLILGLETYGFRPLESVITAMVGVIAVCYLIETWLVRPDWGQVLWHSVVPQFAGKESVFLATGILGATVMPHVIFLHSSLTQARIVTLDEERRRRLYRYEILDVAGAINAVLLDGTPVDAQSLPLAAALARVSGVSLYLVVVVPTLRTLSGVGAASGLLLPATTTKILQLARADASEYLSRQLALLQADGLRVSGEVLRGEPSEIIVKTARQIAPDLIVLGTHHQEGFAAFLSTSAVSKVVNSTHLPLLLVRKSRGTS